MDLGFVDIENSSPTLDFECEIQAGDFHREWVRCSMLANYLARYTAFEFSRREWAENLISTVANDFLEAIVRLAPESGTMILRCARYEHFLLIDMKHDLRPEMMEALGSFLEETRTADVEKLYLDLLTGSGRPAPEFNQLGLIMLIHDFGAKLSTKVDKNDLHATTRLLISTSELVA